jgi:hypothetical protein
MLSCRHQGFTVVAAAGWRILVKVRPCGNDRPTRSVIAKLLCVIPRMAFLTLALLSACSMTVAPAEAALGGSTARTPSPATSPGAHHRTGHGRSARPSVRTRPIAVPGLSIALTGSRDQVRTGDRLTYTVRIKDAGTAGVPQLRVILPLSPLCGSSPRAARAGHTRARSPGNHGCKHQASAWLNPAAMIWSGSGLILAVLALLTVLVRRRAPAHARARFIPRFRARMP